MCHSVTCEPFGKSYLESRRFVVANSINLYTTVRKFWRSYLVKVQSYCCGYCFAELAVLGHRQQVTLVM